MDSEQLKTCIIEPTLQYLEYDNKLYKGRILNRSAVKLLLLTAAIESDMGHFIEQTVMCASNNGGMGIYQIEELTLSWVLKRSYKYPLSKALELKFKIPTSEFINYPRNIIGNLFYQTAIARLIYWYKTADTLPDVDDNEGMWLYYKKWWNSSEGKATKEQFFRKGKKYGII